MIWHLPLIAASTLAASAPAQPLDTKSLVKLSVVSRDTQVKPGDTFQIGLVIDVAKEWHIYWPGQNDSGFPTAVTLTFPPDSGLTAGPVSFPIPKREALPGNVFNYVLEGKVVITVPVKVPATAAIGSKLPITAKVEYLICREACMPGEAAGTATVTVADKTSGNEAAAKLIDDARAAQPKPQTEGFDAAASTKWEGDTLVVTAKDAAVTQMTFFPTDGAAKFLEPAKAGQVKGNTLRLTFDPDKKPVEGVVQITSGNTSKSWTFTLPRPGAPAVGAPAKTAPADKPAAPAEPATAPAR